MFEKFRSCPWYCITSDIEWASEACIEYMVELLCNYSKAVTFFITHKSDILDNFKLTNPKVQFGIHPNFLEGSTHGKTYIEVADHCFELVPNAKTFRAHCFFDTFHICEIMKQKGIKYDSNLGLYLQPDLVPLIHCSGLIRFPVFWEDDVHFRKNKDWNFSNYKNVFSSNGLKIVNFHPNNIALNIPNYDYYLETKNRIGGKWNELDLKDINRLKYNGKGTKSFFLDLLNFIKKNKHNFQNLHELYLISVENR